MNTPVIFPEKISVTDQIIDLSNFPNEWKEKVVELTKKIIDEYRKSGRERFIVAFGGPSGSGKSTTSAVIEYLIKDSTELKVISVSLDGYHYDQEYLINTLDDDGQPLVNHKGRYDTFDTLSIKRDLDLFKTGENVSFPIYSRKTHNPILDAMKCTEKSALLIFEGLWLLYDKKPWNELNYDFTVLLNSPEETLKQNTIKRHVRGGRSLEESKKFYEESDTKNTALILGNIQKHDFDFN